MKQAIILLVLVVTLASSFVKREFKIERKYDEWSEEVTKTASVMIAADATVGSSRLIITALKTDKSETPYGGWLIMLTTEEYRMPPGKINAKVTYSDSSTKFLNFPAPAEYYTYKEETFFYNSAYVMFSDDLVGAQKIVIYIDFRGEGDFEGYFVLGESDISEIRKVAYYKF